MISLENIRKSYRLPQGRFEALSGVDFEVDAGEFVAIVGPSGSGKSTLINMITGIDRPDSGEVHVAGQRLTKLGENRIAKWRGQHVGVIFQFFQLLPTLTVLENVMLPMNYGGTYKNEREARAMRLLDRVNMAGDADKFPSQISGGQQQRAAIARALANDPKILVGDEPTGNLDAASAETIFNLFGELAFQGLTIVIVTHDQTLAARVPRMIHVDSGQIISDNMRAPTFA